MNAPMNDYSSHGNTNTTKDGYANNDMVKATTEDPTGLGEGTLKTIYEKYIEPDFKVDEKSYVIEYQNLLTNNMDSTRYNRYGSATGASSSWGWYPRKLDLMSEMNVYGGIIASSSVYDTGIDNRQYAIFRLKPEFINSYGGQQISYWLKDVASSTQFANVAFDGPSYALSAGSLSGVRPRFLIG